MHLITALVTYSCMLYMPGLASYIPMGTVVVSKTAAQPVGITQDGLYGSAIPLHYLNDINTQMQWIRNLLHPCTILPLIDVARLLGCEFGNFECLMMSPLLY